MDALDQIDLNRHDAMAILDALNSFATLTDAEQDEYFGPLEYAGLDEAEHPLAALLPEGRNGTSVVRDLDGTLYLIWQESSTSDRWLIGPVYRDHLPAVEDIEETLESEPDWLGGLGISVSLTELRDLLLEFPIAPGPVVTF